MNITNDIEEKFKALEYSIQELASIIDEEAFKANNFFSEKQEALKFYWNERRRKALMLSDKIIKAGYGKLTHSLEGYVL